MVVWSQSKEARLRSLQLEDLCPRPRSARSRCSRHLCQELSPAAAPRHHDICSGMPIQTLSFFKLKGIFFSSLLLVVGGTAISVEVENKIHHPGRQKLRTPEQSFFNLCVSPAGCLRSLFDAFACSGTLCTGCLLKTLPYDPTQKWTVSGRNWNHRKRRRNSFELMIAAMKTGLSCWSQRYIHIGAFQFFFQAQKVATGQNMHVSLKKFLIWFPDMPKMAWTFGTVAQNIRLPEFILSKMLCYKSVFNRAEILVAYSLVGAPKISDPLETLS